MIKFLEQARDRTFDPDIVRVTSAAFDDAWQTLQTNKFGVAASDRAAATREILARHIIEMASLGERDQRRLRESSLHHLADVTSRNVRRSIGDISN